MSFDRAARNLLAAMVGKARERLKTDLIDQLSGLGFQADGTALDLDAIAGLSEGERAAARELRALLEHFVAAESGSEAARRQTAFDRLAREIGFTTLNRLVALRMAEERGLIVQSVGAGFGSSGFLIFDRIANGALGGRAATYRAYLECLYDEIARDLLALFDRTDPQSRLFPGERCLDDVLALLNDPALAHLWREDETIGWVYQYYNDPDERKKMRESQAPRTSRELAVRNQFFTPRYVVEFLTDNTLGRLWYEMRRGETRLADECRYLVRRKRIIFLHKGEQPPGQDDLETEFIPYRAPLSPRYIKVLDPACGSVHFLLYAFDVLAIMYEEAEPELPRERIPALILKNNLHGIDIDPRAVQIACLALYLKARKYERNAAIEGMNVVCAAPMPGERVLFEEFLSTLTSSTLARIATGMWDELAQAAVAGSLLKPEQRLHEIVAEQRRLFTAQSQPRQGALLPEFEPPEQLALDFSDVTHDSFWDLAEGRILDLLRRYAEEAEDASATTRHLFAADAARGFRFVDLARKRYDVVLMNPPFGDGIPAAKATIERLYPYSKNDLLAAFVDRGLGLLSQRGRLGAITSRACFFLTSFKDWRQKVLLGRSDLAVMADLGQGVMDAAMVEAAAYVLEIKGVKLSGNTGAAEQRATAR